MLFYAGDLQTLSLEGQIINILGFVEHMVTVAMAQLCYCIAKAALANVWTNECDSIKLYLQK